MKRETIERIYSVLTETFGTKFFNIQQIGVSLTSKNWLHQLLANKEKIGSIVLLADYADLILYAKSLAPQYYNQLKELRQNPDSLRSYFFELYTFRLLDNNNISNEKKIIEGNQEREGVCAIGGIEYLFECRKIYIPNIQVLDVKKDLLAFLLQRFSKMKAGLGFILSIKFKTKPDNSLKYKFMQRIDVFYNGLNSKSFSSINYLDEDEFGYLRVIDYSVESLLEIKTDENYDILFYVIPPSVTTPGVKGFYRASGNVTFSVSSSTLIESLFTKIAEKRKQTQNSSFKRKIFFFDNEIFEETRMGMFQNLYEEEKDIIQTRINESKFNDILCIVSRHYKDNLIQTEFHIFCKEEDAYVREELARLKI
ncbi:hypothetical protein ACLOAU_02205 [Niabella sp. CJ426]|uniref:hypothetical protein n=1 Tax=Niabella sp. CJ426 TaxID=3393740 RepID=UPI003D075C41